MNNRTRYLFLLLFFCLAAVLPAGGKKEESKKEEKSVIVQVTGRVRLVGSGSMSELVITGTDMEWHITPEDEHKLKDLQQRTVTVEGDETVVELTFVSGRSAGARRILSNIKIIAIE